MPSFLSWLTEDYRFVAVLDYEYFFLLLSRSKKMKQVFERRTDLRVRRFPM
jgi:hypothetical protein